ncbi:phosphate ABC transporter permease PstA [Streptomyces hoynatensis]|uniref:Phosphate transport system permease protein PstA n=2 Tax=Streptomyces hoynatensis TaxID=1141874 RepID=A0A3A9Z0N7_9ACTN|nr:phosphate ABC transporter permease PstA [Streptomyces hoynatensis]
MPPGEPGPTRDLPAGAPGARPPAAPSPAPPGAAPPPAPRPVLRPPRLPRWSLAALLTGSLAVGTAAGLICRLSSHLQWGLIAAAVFVAATFGLTARVEGRRRAADRLAALLVWACFAVAVLPLAALVGETVARGAPGVDGYFLTHSMNGVLSWQHGGGVYHALLGTLEQVLLASLLALPVGLLTAVYLVEYGRGRLAAVVTFFVDVMAGIPSIVAGLFVLSLWITILDLGYSGLAGSLALALLMTPIVVRSTEEMLRLVPNELREAALALGVPKWRTTLRVVLPTCAGGIATGVMLALARIAGETAPILLLVFGTNMINRDPFHGAQSSLPLYVYEQWSFGTEPAYERAWAAALVLIALVMLLNLLARALARWKGPRPGP